MTTTSSFLAELLEQFFKLRTLFGRVRGFLFEEEFAASFSQSGQAGSNLHTWAFERTKGIHFC